MIWRHIVPVSTKMITTDFEHLGKGPPYPNASMCKERMPLVVYK